MSQGKMKKLYPKLIAVASDVKMTEEVKKESAVTRFWGAMLKVFAPLM
jgi:hypothetical protein